MMLTVLQTLGAERKRERAVSVTFILEALESRLQSCGKTKPCLPVHGASVAVT